MQHRPLARPVTLQSAASNKGESKSPGNAPGLDSHAQESERSGGGLVVLRGRGLDRLGGQAKELVELVQRVATETAEPIKASASKYYKPAA